MSDPGSSVERPAAPGLQAGAILTALLLSPMAEDYSVLKEIFRRAHWQLYYASHPAQAVRCLRQHRMPVLICERALSVADWAELVDLMQQLAEPPLVIMTSRGGVGENDRSELANRAVFDVLKKPFDGDEVMRVIGRAGRRWRERVAGG